jgi:hypothetical protein
MRYSGLCWAVTLIPLFPASGCQNNVSSSHTLEPLGDRDTAVSVSRAEASWEGRSTGAWVELAKDEDVEKRRKAVQALGELAVQRRC